MKTIYDRIKQKRIELNMTQEELASKLGYKSRSAINKIEKGLRDINQSQVTAFAKVLNCTPAYLMGWNEDCEIEFVVHDTTIIKHIKLFEQLTDTGKEKVIDYTEMVYNSEQKDNN